MPVKPYISKSGDKIQAIKIAQVEKSDEMDRVTMEDGQIFESYLDHELPEVGGYFVIYDGGNVRFDKPDEFEKTYVAL